MFNTLLTKAKRLLNLELMVPGFLNVPFSALEPVWLLKLVLKSKWYATGLWYHDFRIPSSRFYWFKLLAIIVQKILNVKEYIYFNLSVWAL